MCPAIGLFRAGLLTLDHFAGQVSILGRSERQRLQVGTTAGCMIATGHSVRQALQVECAYVVLPARTQQVGAFFAGALAMLPRLAFAQPSTPASQPTGTPGWARQA